MRDIPMKKKTAQAPHHHKLFTIFTFWIKIWIFGRAFQKNNCQSFFFFFYDVWVFFSKCVFFRSLRFFPPNSEYFFSHSDVKGDTPSFPRSVIGWNDSKLNPTADDMLLTCWIENFELLLVVKHMRNRYRTCPVRTLPNFSLSFIHVSCTLPLDINIFFERYFPTGE